MLIAVINCHSKPNPGSRIRIAVHGNGARTLKTKQGCQKTVGGHVWTSDESQTFALNRALMLTPIPDLGWGFVAMGLNPKNQTQDNQEGSRFKRHPHPRFQKVQPWKPSPATCVTARIFSLSIPIGKEFGIEIQFDS